MNFSRVTTANAPPPQLPDNSLDGYTAASAQAVLTTTGEPGFPVRIRFESFGNQDLGQPVPDSDPNERSIDAKCKESIDIVADAGPYYLFETRDGRGLILANGSDLSEHLAADLDVLLDEHSDVLESVHRNTGSVLITESDGDFKIIGTSVALYLEDSEFGGH